MSAGGVGLGVVANCPSAVILLSVLASIISNYRPTQQSSRSLTVLQERILFMSAAAEQRAHNGQEAHHHEETEDDVDHHHLEVVSVFADHA
jgi:hypothetical protein